MWTFYYIETKKKACINYPNKEELVFPFKSMLFIYFIYSKFLCLNFKASEYHYRPSYNLSI